MTYFEKNIIDNEICVCGEIENDSYFCFDCPRFYNQRHIMINKLRQLYNQSSIGDNGNPRSDVIGLSRGLIGWQKIERKSCFLSSLADILNV